MTARDLKCPPLPPTRPYHYASLIRGDGGVSALCFTSPRAIDMRRATWTTSPEPVTCPKCRKALAERSRAA